MIQEEIETKLTRLADENYRAFSEKLLPGTKNILGVRLPQLRPIAKEIAQNDWRGYLATGREEYYEDLLIKGLAIGYAKVPPQELLPYIAAFVPKIKNWGVCDTFCCQLKIVQKDPSLFWEFLQPYLEAEEEFAVRFGVVLLLAHFIHGDRIKAVLAALDSVSHPGYYVKMAVAWAVSTCYIKFPTETTVFLHDNRLDTFTFNKSLQKITESRRVSAETKAKIRAMKRKEI